MEERPGRIAFLHIIEQYHLGIELLARVAGVSPWSVFYMANGDPVERETIEKVLKAVETLIGQVYTLDDVDVVVKEDAADP